MSQQIQPNLSARALSVGYTTPILRALDLDLYPGELVCLIGPNGAGKSTLLRSLSGMRKPLNGTISIKNEDLRTLSPIQLARHLSIVLTDRVDIGNLNVFSLAALGRYPYTSWHGGLTSVDIDIVTKALEQAGAISLADRPVYELSDGERQKVMIARALAQQPEVLLLDEPTAFLDMPRRVDLFSLLRSIARDTHSAVLLSTHDLDLALRVADRLWLIAADGAFYQGIPEQLALNGSIASVFQSEGVLFDHTTGAFKIDRATRGQVELTGEGDGIALAWTWRALERVGFQVVENAPHLAIRVRVHDHGHWTVANGTSVLEYDDFESLLKALG